MARMQERIYIESPLIERRGLVPDVHVFEDSARRSSTTAVSVLAVTPTEPDVLSIGAIEITERFIEIRDARSDGRVITVIEFVSSTNKMTRIGRRKYLQKQNEVLGSEATNLVEIDLLRQGKPVTLAVPAIVPKARRATYHAAVHRALRPDKLEYYAIRLRERLPVIKVPLRAGDADVVVDVQSALNDAYRDGLYGETIDYAQPPSPPLKPEDAAWANELIQKWNS